VGGQYSASGPCLILRTAHPPGSLTPVRETAFFTRLSALSYATFARRLPRAFSNVTFGCPSMPTGDSGRGARGRMSSNSVAGIPEIEDVNPSARPNHALATSLLMENKKNKKTLGGGRDV